MLDITVPVGTPVEEDADELVAAPDAVGFEIRVAECPVVAFGVPAFVVGERLFVKLPGFGPALVCAGFERYELQWSCHRPYCFAQNYYKFRALPIRLCREGRSVT